MVAVAQGEAHANDPRAEIGTAILLVWPGIFYTSLLSVASGAHPKARRVFRIIGIVYSALWVIAFFAITRGDCTEALFSLATLFVALVIDWVSPEPWCSPEPTTPASAIFDAELIGYWVGGRDAAFKEKLTEYRLSAQKQSLAEALASLESSAATPEWLLTLGRSTRTPAEHAYKITGPLGVAEVLKAFIAARNKAREKAEPELPPLCRGDALSNPHWAIGLDFMAELRSSATRKAASEKYMEQDCSLLVGDSSHKCDGVDSRFFRLSTWRNPGSSARNSTPQ